MSKAQRIQQALEQAEANIALMAGWPHQKLKERLELVNIQSAIAEEKRDTESLELLEVWRSQLIEARIRKYEDNIADTPNEIEQAIAEIETVTAKLEEREEILSHEQEVQSTKPRKQIEQTPQGDQLGLFQRAGKIFPLHSPNPILTPSFSQ